jgi:TRAP-type transport system small permease protein
MHRLYEKFCRAEALVAGLFLILMVALIFVSGLARLAHHPFNWTMDLATCLFAWACFLCADIAWRQDSMMSVEIVTERLPDGTRRLLTLVNYALIALFLLFLIGSGFWLSYVSRARPFQGIPGVSYSWVTASLPIGGILLLITTIRKAQALLATLPAAPDD